MGYSIYIPHPMEGTTGMDPNNSKFQLELNFWTAGIRPYPNYNQNWLKCPCLLLSPVGIGTFCPNSNWNWLKYPWYPAGNRKKMPVRM